MNGSATGLEYRVTGTLASETLPEGFSHGDEFVTGGLANRMVSNHLAVDTNGLAAGGTEELYELVRVDSAACKALRPLVQSNTNMTGSELGGVHGRVTGSAQIGSVGLAEHGCRCLFTILASELLAGTTFYSRVILNTDHISGKDLGGILDNVLVNGRRGGSSSTTASVVNTW